MPAALIVLGLKPKADKRGPFRTDCRRVSRPSLRSAPKEQCLSERPFMVTSLVAPFLNTYADLAGAGSLSGITQYIRLIFTITT